MPPLDTAPFFHQVALDPTDDFASQPLDVDGGVVAAGRFAFGVGCAGDVDDVDECVGVSEIIEEFVTQALSFVCARDEAGDVQKFDRDGTFAIHAGPVVGSASVGETMACTGTVDLEVAYSALGVDGSETSESEVKRCKDSGRVEGPTGSCLRRNHISLKVPSSSRQGFGEAYRMLDWTDRLSK